MTVLKPIVDLRAMAIVIFATAVVCLSLGPSHFNGLDASETIVERVVNRFYFAVTTVSTVGYGDISPKSLVAKCVVMTAMLTLLGTTVF